MTKVIAILALALSALTACSSIEKIDLSSTTAVIDVRTPEEFASGHLKDAVNINVDGPDWASQIGVLDKTGNYVVYCRSGRRSALAIENMTQSGFTGQLINAGGIDEATSALGIPIVVD